jgi:hypothetical protein
MRPGRIARTWTLPPMHDGQLLRIKKAAGLPEVGPDAAIYHLIHGHHRKESPALNPICRIALRASPTAVEPAGGPPNPRA